MTKIFNNHRKRGYAVLELIFYISFFAVLSLVAINAMLTMAKSLKETAIQAEFVQSGTILEKISREIRAAYDIDATSTSTDLKLDTTSGTNTKVEFKLLGSDLQFLENDVFTGNLNTPNIIITSLNFTQINTTKGAAVQIYMVLRSSNDPSGRLQSFYDTIVLRGDYQN